jgi:hypothetical protein
VENIKKNLLVKDRFKKFHPIGVKKEKLKKKKKVCPVGFEPLPVPFLFDCFFSEKKQYLFFPSVIVKKGRSN